MSARPWLAFVLAVIVVVAFGVGALPVARWRGWIRGEEKAGEKQVEARYGLDDKENQAFTTILNITPPPDAVCQIIRDEQGRIFVVTAGLPPDVISAEQVQLLTGLATRYPHASLAVRQSRYLAGLIVSPELAPPLDPAERLRRYLDRQLKEPEPLRPTEEDWFVPLAGMLSDDLSLRIELSTRPRSASADQPNLFTAHGQPFDDIRKAVEAVDPDTRQPYRLFALLGEPGAGKSTVLRQLALAATRERLNDAHAPLPLFVNLGGHEAGTPRDFLRAHWRERLGDDGFDAALKSGRVWLFADGLNEMPREGYDERVQLWRDFLHRDFPAGNRAIVACRTTDYGNGLDLPRLSILPMDAERIREFARKRLPDLADDLWRDLRRDRGNIYELARNPFWLTALLAVYRRVDLPRNRAALAGTLVDEWLDYENDRPGGTRLSPEARAAFLLALDRLGFALLAEGQNSPMPQAGALTHLPAEVEVSGQTIPTPPLDMLKLAESVSLILRAGRPESLTVRFYHQLLLEYFAGRDLLRRFRERDDLSTLWRIPWERWQFVQSGWDPLPPPPSTGWEEATVLAAGLPEADVDALARAVAAEHPPLAARCLLEVGSDEFTRPAAEAATTAATTELITEKLLAIVNDAEQRLPLRIAAGKALGDLGDPRIGARGKLGSTKFVEPKWCPVPAGSFLMGSRDDDEGPPHEFDIPYDYRIAAYPVTNSEYACFVEAEGYKTERYWKTPAAREWLKGGGDPGKAVLDQWRAVKQAVERDPELPDRNLSEGIWQPETAEAFKQIARMSDEELTKMVREFYSRQDRDRPAFWDDRRFNNPSQPVVGVCWHEARAYFDLAGNVWEWTLSRWGSDVFKTAFKYPYDPKDGREDPTADDLRVVRGGSWPNNRRFARSAFRLRLVPALRVNDLGFRLVVSPIFLLMPVAPTAPVIAAAEAPKDGTACFPARRSRWGKHRIGPLPE